MTDFERRYGTVVAPENGLSRYMLVRRVDRAASTEIEKWAFIQLRRDPSEAPYTADVLVFPERHGWREADDLDDDEIWDPVDD